MKRIILIWLLGCISLSSLAQDTLSKKSGYFTAIKKNNGGSQILSVGDKVTIRVKSKKSVRGKIVEINQYYILIDSKGKIEITQIKWIKKSKPDSGIQTIGIALTFVGAASLIPIWSGDEFDAIDPIGAIGISLSICGIALLTPPKYNLHKGDKLVFKNLE